MGKKWEYMARTYRSENGTRAQLDDMNKLGDERWEVMSIRDAGYSTVVWFKRPKIEKQELTEG